MFSEALLDCNLNQQLMSIPRPNIEMSITVPFCSSLVASGLSHPLSCTQTEIILKRQTYFELQMWCLCLSFLWLTMSCFFSDQPILFLIFCSPTNQRRSSRWISHKFKTSFPSLCWAFCLCFFLRAAVFFKSSIVHATVFSVPECQRLLTAARVQKLSLP